MKSSDVIRNPRSCPKLSQGESAGTDFSQFAENRIIRSDETVILYHGSKSGSEANRSKGIAAMGEICRKYRRDGRFFDEILKEGE